MTPVLLPEGVPSWQMPYWDALKQHRVLVQRCDVCGTHRYSPKEVCAQCWSPDFTWNTVSGDGEVYSYTVVHQAPTKGFQTDAPYAIAYVEMFEGFRMIGRLVGISVSEIHIGMPVATSFQSLDDDWTAVIFAPRRPTAS